MAIMIDAILVQAVRRTGDDDRPDRPIGLVGPEVVSIDGKPVPITYPK
jgi:hypothetical protein